MQNRPSTLRIAVAILAFGGIIGIATGIAGIIVASFVGYDLLLASLSEIVCGILGLISIMLMLSHRVLGVVVGSCVLIATTFVLGYGGYQAVAKTSDIESLAFFGPMELIALIGCLCVLHPNTYSWVARKGDPWDKCNLT
jgi:hypothetical protein